MQVLPRQMLRAAVGCDGARVSLCCWVATDVMIHGMAVMALMLKLGTRARILHARHFM